MSSTLIKGPFKEISLPDGSRVPYYIIPFDKHGRCIGPETRQLLVDAAGSGGFSDTLIFSHGWNNDWTAATRRYEDFIRGYMGMRQSRGLPMPDDFKPLMVGIFWPSTALVFSDSETGPEIAGAAGDPREVEVSIELEEISALADEMAPEHVERFYALLQKSAYTEAEALELATIARPFFTGDDEVHDDVTPTPETIVRLWAEACSPANDDFSEFEDFGHVGEVQREGPATAGIGDLLQRLDPRQIVRALTVRQMKDRAGKVGAQGVHSLLVDLLKVSTARIHLIGHSYGGKLVLSAVCHGALSRQVDSMLLLQPAVSHLCFAEKVPRRDRAGGYRRALDLVRQPILCTFSNRDLPLTKLFHLALRREADLGELRIAGDDKPPSRFAALGGFGPRKAGEQLIEMPSVNQPYPEDADTRLYGLRAHGLIGGHGDISNEATWWALYSLLSRPQVAHR